MVAGAGIGLTEHHSPLRRIHILAGHVDQHGLEVGIVGDLERLCRPRFEIVVPTDPSHGVLADSEPFRQRAGGPMSRPVIGGFLESDPHHSATVPSGSHNRRPRPSVTFPTASTSPARNRSRQRITVFGHVPNSRAVARIDTPSASLNNARGKHGLLPGLPTGSAKTATVVLR
jgi:hypothetical protein